MPKKVMVDRNPKGGMKYNAYFTIGCDPEIFLTDAKGRVVGSERVIPEGGLSTSTYYDGTKIVRDGVQMEIHPDHTTCRANVGNNIQYALQELRMLLNSEEHKGKFKVSFADVVTVRPKELASLSESCRMLGCAPSLNLYRPSRIKVNPLTYRKRSGGGHIHISDIPAEILADNKKIQNFIAMLDVFAGNTCVMIDRSPNARIRRRVYGRAGEYRRPAWGLEYRTLSNFWMHSYQLFSLVSALVRMGGSASYTTWYRSHSEIRRADYADLEGIVLDTVNLPRIRKAINRNDLELAQQNWEDLKPIIKQYYPNRIENGYGFEGICAQVIKPFEYFCQKVQEEGLRFWWDHDPLQHWCDKQEGHGTGWETFMIKRIVPAWEAVKAAEKAAKEAAKAESTVVVEPVAAMVEPPPVAEVQADANPDQATA